MHKLKFLQLQELYVAPVLTIPLSPLSQHAFLHCGNNSLMKSADPIKTHVMTV